MQGKLDNKPQVIEKERIELEEELAKINPSLMIVSVMNETRYTDFVLHYTSTEFEEKIEDMLFQRNKDKYTSGHIDFLFDLEEPETSSNWPSLKVPKRTCYIRRIALIEYKRSLKSTMCIEVALVGVLFFILWLAYRILTV
jgi:hypothetical protein